MTMVMATNNGPHTAEHWAGITVKQIVDINPNATGDVFIQGKMLEMKMIQSLVKFHKDIQDLEKGKLSVSNARLNETINPEETEADIEAMVLELVSHALGTPFEGHFAQAVTKQHIRQVLNSHFATSMDIERSWHCDNTNNPNCPHLQAYKEARRAIYS